MSRQASLATNVIAAIIVAVTLGTGRPQAAK
jgi:hypothetical protein